MHSTRLNKLLMQVEGVPALIHQTEVSWDTTLDPASYYKIGQVIWFSPAPA